MSVGYDQMLLSDFEARDDLQNVTLVSGATTTLNVRAKTLKLTFQQIALGGALGIQPTDRRMLIGCSSLVAAVPRQGDKITDAGNTSWTIITSDLKTFGDTPMYYETVVRRQL